MASCTGCSPCCQQSCASWLRLNPSRGLTRATPGHLQHLPDCWRVWGSKHAGAVVKQGCSWDNEALARALEGLLWANLRRDLGAC